VDKSEVRWAELDVGVEQATKVYSPSVFHREAQSDMNLDANRIRTAECYSPA
jgi:hypothetical protein